MLRQLKSLVEKTQKSGGEEVKDVGTQSLGEKLSLGQKTQSLAEKTQKLVEKAQKPGGTQSLVEKTQKSG